MGERNTIIIADDKKLNRLMLRDIFSDDYEIIEAIDGSDTITKLEENIESICAVLLDIYMPNMNGFEVISYFRKKGYLNTIPVVFITGINAGEVESKGFELGVSDFITKPFNMQIVSRRVRNIIGLYEHKNNLEYLVKQQTDQIEVQAKKLEENNQKVIEILSTVVEFRNFESGNHIQRVKEFTRVIAIDVAKKYPEYELDDRTVERISLASTMHDVGKIAIPDTILLKPGKFTPEEYEVMQSHTLRGCDIIDQLKNLEDAEYYSCCYEICRSHHERYNGQGYPDKLKGEDIPISAQIVSIADVYDALVSERVYKKAYSVDTAYQMIISGECGVFSPKIMACFKELKPRLEEIVKINQEDM